MELARLYRDHITTLAGLAEGALERSHAAGRGFDGIVFHAGAIHSYHADDLSVPFRSTPHFVRFAPVPGPDHLLLFRPGESVRLVRVVPEGYWEEPPETPVHPFAEVLVVEEVPNRLAAARRLGGVSSCAYVGDDPDLAAALGIEPDGVEPPALLSALDWDRAYKTPYEVACIREANRIAARGHRAARRGFGQCLSERAIHADYLAATGLLEAETPYPNIIAWDDRAAVLHYQRKRATDPSPGHTFLIDAGARCHGYASDVTRTYAAAAAHPVFREALDRMEGLQQRIAAAVAPGMDYAQLHALAIEGLARILVDLGVLQVPVEEALQKGLVLPFLPHGLGHHLGIQVHDVGGLQVSPGGDQRPPPEAHPYLRTTRRLEAGHVVTVEPGLYLVPRLLDAHRGAPDARAFDWGLVDSLIPCGGIRIEDDVHVTALGCDNLTRQFLPGHLGDRLEAQDPAG